MTGRSLAPLAVLLVLALTQSEVLCDVDAGGKASQLVATQQFREVAVRMLEAGHGWINCLLSTRPFPPPVEIIKMMSNIMGPTSDLLAELLYVGYALQNGAVEEQGPKLQECFNRLVDLRASLHTYVHHTLNPELRMAGNCYTVT